MPGFPTVDSLVNAWTVNGTGQKLFFNKTCANTTVIGVPTTMWTATGMPSAGGYGSLGKASGRVLTQATVGALPYGNSTAPATNHIISGGNAALTANGTGFMLVVDRIADVLLAHSETTGSIVGVDATSRIGPSTGNGAGVQLWLEVQTIFSAASNTFTFGYTNSLGVAGRVTPAITTTASATVGRTPSGSMLWTPLQAGDSGIRTLDSFTLSSGTATGQFAACLVRPIASLPIVLANQLIERDFVVEIPNMERIYDSSCLSLIWVPTGAIATPAFMGEIRVCAN